jgi:hypothetical protein
MKRPYVSWSPEPWPSKRVSYFGGRLKSETGGKADEAKRFDRKVQEASKQEEGKQLD